MTNDTREALAAMREASRAITGDEWRDEWEEIAEEFEAEDDDPRASLDEIIGFSYRLTYGLGDGEGGEE